MTAVILTFLYFIPNVKKKWDDNWPLPSIFFGYVIYPKPYKIQAKGHFGMTTGFDLVRTDFWNWFDCPNCRFLFWFDCRTEFFVLASDFSYWLFLVVRLSVLHFCTGSTVRAAIFFTPIKNAILTFLYWPPTLCTALFLLV
jgi:hypothetical protein